MQNIFYSISTGNLSMELLYQGALNFYSRIKIIFVSKYLKSFTGKISEDIFSRNLRFVLIGLRLGMIFLIMFMPVLPKFMLNNACSSSKHHAFLVSEHHHLHFKKNVFQWNQTLPAPSHNHKKSSLQLKEFLQKASDYIIQSLW